MSCEQGTNKISGLAGRVGAGIAQLANKRGFYAGLVLGGAGIVGAGLVAVARRWSDSGRTATGQTKQRTAIMQPVPQLPTRAKISPVVALSSGSRCADCQTPASGKEGNWYSINGRVYCPDCAPDKAHQTGVDLVAARSAGDNGASTFGRSRPAGMSSGGQNYLRSERRVETRLEPSRIRVNIGQDSRGLPPWLVVNQGYVLVRPGGWDTGLAITPGMRIGGIRNGAPEVEENTSEWWLTHIPSGRRLCSQPYANLTDAHSLGSILAQMDWTRPENEISNIEVRQAQEMIYRFNQALTGRNGWVSSGQPPPSRPEPSAPTGPIPVAGKPLANSGAPVATAAGPVSLEGKLVADGYGGVARVLEDNGDKLFMVDNVGTRYEVSRGEVRPPNEQDFEMCRVAMSFDPTTEPEASCTQCGQSSRQAEKGSKWYKMARPGRPFCSSCAAEYAATEGYIKDDEIGVDLEPIMAR